MYIGYHHIYYYNDMEIIRNKKYTALTLLCIIIDSFHHYKVCLLESAKGNP